MTRRAPGAPSFRSSEGWGITSELPGNSTRHGLRRAEIRPEVWLVMAKLTKPITVSRKTATAIAELYSLLFTQRFDKLDGRVTVHYQPDELYDFIFDHGFDPAFCTCIRRIRTHRELELFIKSLVTGESYRVLGSQHQRATEDAAMRQGRQYLLLLAQTAFAGLDNGDITSYPVYKDAVLRVTRQLSLDGWMWTGTKLTRREESVIDEQEEAGYLQSLYMTLGLQDSHTTFHHLGLSEEHYVSKRWDDSISNSRKVLEKVLYEVAACYSNDQGTSPPQDRPVAVRDFLKKHSLLTDKEHGVVNAVYQLLSETGGHPNMAESEQARLLRHLALTLCQFVMLRLRHALGV